MSFLILVAAGSVLGAWALRRFGLRHDVEGLCLRLMVGMSLCAALVLALGAYRLRLAQAALFVVAAGGLAYELFARPRRRAAPEAPAAIPADGPGRYIDYASGGAILAAMMLAAVSSLAPPTQWDAVTAHLAIASDYTRMGRIAVFEGNAYSAYPHLLHCLYTGAYFQGGETAAALTGWALSGLSLLAAYVLGRRMGGRRCGLIAAAALATAPIFCDQAGTVALDLAFAGMVAAALAALLAWNDERRDPLLLLAGFLVGSSCGIRHTGYLVCVLLGVGTLLSARRMDAWPAAIRAGLMFTAAALLGAVPWLARSALELGNPFYPFFMFNLDTAALPDAPITAVAAHDSLRISIRDFVMFPWNIVMRPHLFDGWSKSPGPLVLFLGLPGLVVGGPRARRVAAFCIAGGVCLFFYRQYARYYLPFFVPMMAVAGLGACRLPALRRGIAVMLTASYIFGLGLFAAAVHFKVPVALGLEAREDYLARRVERYGAFDWANTHLPENRVIMTFDPRSYYLARPTYQNTEALKPLLDKPFEEHLAWLRERNIAYLFYPDTYMRESPGFAQTGVLDLVSRWRGNRRHFACIQMIMIPRTRGGAGYEQVEVYEVHYDR